MIGMIEEEKRPKMRNAQPWLSSAASVLLALSHSREDTLLLSACMEDETYLLRLI